MGTRPGGKRGRFARLVILACVVGIAGWYVALGAGHPWDFETYYYAASAYRAGLDPYSLDSLSTVAGRTVQLPFLYAPVTLWLFLPLSHLTVSTASVVWLGFKCILIVALVWIWWEALLRPASIDLLVVVTLLGFNLALLWDLRTGNVALLEEVLLWVSFWGYLRGRVWLFAVLVAVAASFKLYPVVFLALALLPVDTRARRWWPVAVGVAVLVGLVAFPSRWTGQWARALVGSLTREQPGIAVDSSAAGILHSLMSGWNVAGELRVWLSPMLYAAYCFLLLFLSGPSISRTLLSGSRRCAVVGAVCLWLLLAPRAMVYSYVMAVAPALAMIRYRFQSPVAQSVAATVLLIPGILRLIPGPTPTIVGAMPLFLVLWLWVSLGSQRRPLTT